MFDISNIKSTQDIKYTTPLIKYFIYNSYNTFYETGRRLLTFSLVQSAYMLDEKSNNATNLFFILLAIYLLFILIQSIIGYFLLKTSLLEENLFLILSHHDCIRLQKRCTNFIINSKVFSEQKILKNIGLSIWPRRRRRRRYFKFPICACPI